MTWASDKDWVKQVLTNKEVNFNQQTDVVEVSNLFVTGVSPIIFVYKVNMISILFGPNRVLEFVSPKTTLRTNKEIRNTHLNSDSTTVCQFFFAGVSPATTQQQNTVAPHSTW